MAWIGLQTLVNLGGVTGLLPITGVPLPLVSFGGSSLVVTLAGIGILVSIGRAGAVPAAVRGSTAGDRRSGPKPRSTKPTTPKKKKVAPPRSKQPARPARTRQRSTKSGAPVWGSARRARGAGR